MSKKIGDEKMNKIVLLPEDFSGVFLHLRLFWRLLNVFKLLVRVLEALVKSSVHLCFLFQLSVDRTVTSVEDLMKVNF